MSSKTITLSPQSVIALAHNVMVPHGIKCEWSANGKPCMVLLSCWELVRQVCLCFLSKKIPLFAIENCKTDILWSSESLS